MAAVTLVVLVATAAGVGAERRWGDRTRLATGRLLDWMLYLVLPPVTFFIVARLELTAGVGAGLLFVAPLIGTHDLGPAIAYDAVVSSPVMYGVGFAIGATMGTRAGVSAGAR